MLVAGGQGLGRRWDADQVDVEFVKDLGDRNGGHDQPLAVSDLAIDQVAHPRGRAAD